MTYGGGGLLASFATPSGTSTFTYDALGLLVQDDGPDGTSTTLARTETATGFITTPSAT